jgi:hypothetical protein
MVSLLISLLELLHPNRFVLLLAPRLRLVCFKTRVVMHPIFKRICASKDTSPGGNLRTCVIFELLYRSMII